VGIKKIISLNEDDLLRVQQIVFDRDKEEALFFIKEVIQKQIDREDASKMKREGI
jgi:hypothetical protein